MLVKTNSFHTVAKRKENHMTGTITFTKESLMKLKDAYALAVTEGRDQFTFEGHELLTSYAKYLIQHLDHKFA